MTLTRWNPTRDLFRIQEEFDRLFRGFLPETSLARGTWEPAVDICEADHEYSITADLPGLTKDEIKVNYQDGVLTIFGEKKQEKEEKGKNYHRLERGYGAFERSFRLPSRVQADKIRAEFKDGVLHLTLPKADEARPKEIPIRIN
jgi:HSP20 family protein